MTILLNAYNTSDFYAVVLAGSGIILMSLK